MWIFAVFLCAVVAGLLKWISDLKGRLDACKNEQERLQTRLESNGSSRSVLIRWIEQSAKGEDLAAYFRRRDIHRIAIYGMTDVGEFLYRMLRDSDIEVVCGIDRSKTLENLPVLRPADFQEEVDAVIVATVYYFSEIYDLLDQKLWGKTPILGLDEVIYELSLSE